MAYVATTRGIKVTVNPVFLDDRSDPGTATWVWAYQVSITNNGVDTVQLLRRTWRITDANGRTQVVQGEGVVGEQPVLRAGETFEYTSGTPLDTSSGIMSGTFHMVLTLTGEDLDIAVPAFSLDSPDQVRLVH